jgi:hypothetical protein
MWLLFWWLVFIFYLNLVLLLIIKIYYCKYYNQAFSENFVFQSYNEHTNEQYLVFWGG